MKFINSLFGVVAILLTANAQANVTYTYVGNNYDAFAAGATPTDVVNYNIGNIFNSGQHYQFSFTTSSALAANTYYGWKSNILLDGANFGLDSATLLSWNDSNGVNNFGSNVANTGLFGSITTDANGNIASWGFLTSTLNGSQPEVTNQSCGLSLCASSIMARTWTGQFNWSYQQYAGDTIMNNANVPTNFSGAASTTPGTWSVTVSPVPEPDTISLMFAGFSIVGWVIRRRKQN